MFNDVLSIETYPTVSDHGNDIVDYTADPTVVTVPGCDAQPGSPQEQSLPRADLDRVSWTVWCPTGTGLADDALVRVNGGPLCRSIGLPQVWGSGAGALDHVIVYLERWVG